jgi:hypothetical protein
MMYETKRKQSTFFFTVISVTVVLEIMYLEMYSGLCNVYKCMN